MVKSIMVHVTSLDAELEFKVSAITTGGQLFDQVMKTLGVRETQYFGLLHADHKGSLTWLKPHKKIIAQDVHMKESLELLLRVKFFPENVLTELIQTRTRHLFYLQILKSILDGILFCPAETAVLLASYSMQSRYGNYVHQMPELSRSARLLPQSIIDVHSMTREMWEDQIAVMYRTHTGMTAEDAEMEYLKVAEDLDMYGINYFEIKNKKGTDLFLGVDALGMSVFQAKDLCTPKIAFPWSEIHTISYADKKFRIKPADKKSPEFTFVSQRYRINKRILQLCIGNHDLFMTRRKGATMEQQQMRAEAEMERKRRMADRELLHIEQEARREAEKTALKLHERVHEVESSQSEMIDIILSNEKKVAELEIKAEEAQVKLEESNKLISLTTAQKEAESKDDEVQAPESHSFISVPDDISSLPCPEDSRVDYLDTNKKLQEQLEIMRKELEQLRHDKLARKKDHKNAKVSKFQTLRKIKAGAIKERIMYFEQL